MVVREGRVCRDVSSAKGKLLATCPKSVSSSRPTLIPASQELRSLQPERIIQIRPLARTGRAADSRLAGSTFPHLSSNPPHEHRKTRVTRSDRRQLARPPITRQQRARRRSNRDGSEATLIGSWEPFPSRQDHAKLIDVPAAKDDRLAPPSLLDLPEEVLQRIFRYVGDTYGPVRMIAWDEDEPPMSYLRLSKRLFPLIRDNWYRHVAVDGDPVLRGDELANLALKPQAVLRAIQTAHVVFSTDDTPLHYAVFAQLVNLQSLSISGEPGRDDIDTESLQRLLDALPRLKEVEFGDLPPGPIAIRLPDTVRSLVTPASAFTTEALARLNLRELRILFGPSDVVRRTLPWDHLERLEMQFTEAAWAAPILQSYAAEVCLEAVESPCTDDLGGVQTDRGIFASQLRNVTINLLVHMYSAFPLARLLHGVFAEAAVESFDIFAVTLLVWEPLALSESIRKLDIYFPDRSRTKVSRLCA